MSQTYTSGTILSVGFGPTLEQVIVLSDNKVATKTYAGQPVTRRDIMSLDDWRILATSTGQEIQTDYLPLVSSATPTVATSIAMAVAVALPQPQPELEKVYPVGTMLRWKKDPENRRCAIILKDGILQVKEVIMGRFTLNTLGRCKQMFFSSLADWKSTLPADGTLTASEVTEDQTIPSIKRKAAQPVTATTDADYIKVLLERFSVRSYLFKKPRSIDMRNSSVKQIIQNVGTLQKHLDALKNISTDTALNAATINDTLHSIRHFAKSITYDSEKAYNAQRDLCYGRRGNDAEDYSFHNDYKQVLYAFVDDEKIEITSSNGLIGLAYDKKKNYMGKWFTPTVGKSFAELGLELKADGKPRLCAHYRKGIIEV